MFNTIQLKFYQFIMLCRVWSPLRAQMIAQNQKHQQRNAHQQEQLARAQAN